MRNKKIPEPWLSFFLEIDEQVSEKIELECLGGFVITQIYGLARTTADVDVISVNPKSQSDFLFEIAGEGSILHQKHKVYLDWVGVAQLPENYDERLTEVFQDTFKYISFFALDPYDIALAKIERNIQRDRDDVKYLAATIPFDLEILKARYETELRPILGNPNREDLTLKLWVEAIEEERAKN
ncbi:MAG: hypothetical protein K1X72_23515 [Pyrinomonadaceae bacterium]|nr:hypothetical protein [Pyrinomonadaceae bacterium]